MTDLAGHDAEAREAARDVTSALDELVALVEHAKSMPLSSSIIASREELLDLLHEALEALPSELSRARRVLKDQEDVLEQTRRDASELLDDARAQAAHMVERTEVVRQARYQAERTIAEAESDARRIRHEADDYVDRKLAAFEIVLDRTMRTVQAGRDRLTGLPGEEEEGDDALGHEEGGEDGFFDQDRA